MAESTERLVFDIFARDRGASATFDKVGRSADHAGGQIDGMGKSATHLDRDIDTTRNHLRGLIAEFEKTGNTELFKDIRKSRSTLGLLESMRKELGQVGPEVEKAGATAGKEFNSGFGDALGALPLQARGAMILGITTLIAANLPTIGAMIGGAVLGGVGIGGIVGGIALAAQDPAVAKSAQDVGRSFMQSLKNEASQSLAGPLLAALSPLERAGQDLAETLGRAFKDLAPAVQPLAHGIEGFVRELGPGLSKAFKAAEPAIQALARELPNLGNAIGDALRDIAKGSDGAIMGLIALLRVVEGVIRGGGLMIRILSDIFEGIVRIEGAVASFTAQLPIVGLLAPAFALGAKGADELTGALNDAHSTGSSFVGTIADLVRGFGQQEDATTKARDAMVEWAKTVQDQADPTFNLIHRLQDVKQAQLDYTKAVHDHGTKSPEARDAELKLAEAILAANTAAATASGMFDGHFTEAMKNILRQGHMTEKQIRDVEKAFQDATKAGKGFEGVYTATARIKFETKGFGAIHFDPEGNPVGHRASGGPVLPNRSYVVGEHGIEILQMGSSGGYVHSNGASTAMLSGASGGSAGPTQFEVIGRFEGSGVERDLGEALLKFVRYQVRQVGGGSVQDTYGKPEV